MNYSGLFTYQSFRGWLEAYDIAPLIEEPLAITDQPLKILTSTLPRAIQTAKGLYPHAELHSFDFFNSVPVPVVPLPFVKWPLQRWIALNRHLYECGVPAPQETVWETRRRASRAVVFLDKLAHELQDIVLVGHGCMNVRIAKTLLCAGWVGSAPQKVNYLGSLQLEYPA